MGARNYKNAVRPTFLFTGLNDLKPEMIAEATAKVREAAQQFASDSQGELGGIRRANQGIFSPRGLDGRVLSGELGYRFA